MQNLALVLALLGIISLPAFSEDKKSETKSEAVELKNDTVRGAKKAVRAVEDKACEMINGKMECAVKKIKNSAKNAGDQVEDIVD